MLQFPCFQINAEIIHREEITWLQQNEIEPGWITFAFCQNMIVSTIGIPPNFKQLLPDGKLILQQCELIAAFSFQQISDIQLFLQIPFCINLIFLTLSISHHF